MLFNQISEVLSKSLEKEASADFSEEDWARIELTPTDSLLDHPAIPAAIKDAYKEVNGPGEIIEIPKDGEEDHA